MHKLYFLYHFAVHFKSFHPRHLKPNLPFGQFINLKCNTTENTKYGEESKKLTLQLKKGDI